MRHCIPCLFFLIACAIDSSLVAADHRVDFSRDVRPILAANCFKCHGPDEATREAELRLDLRESAVSDLGDRRAISPSDPAQSELIARVTSDDEFEQMPPTDSGLSLTEEDIQTLRLWIQQGAEYDKHWAFKKPVQPEIPQSDDTDWGSHPIDAFILEKMQQQGLSPSPVSDKLTLIRRVYLDLIGLPPTIEEADEFVNSDDPEAYEKIVDRLLESPHYGERWARHWLDLARYADTNGYEKDRPRSIWPYRDWVIEAINNDMPFDQFTIEQLAGDMLHQPTREQLIATGFHRNTMLNEEGGIDPLEYRFYAMVDRIATTGTVWMGMTIGCAQCHTHKYDPITHNDYYGLMAYLNNADEPDLIVPDPSVEVARQNTLDKIAALESQLIESFPPLEGEGPVENRRRENFNTKFEDWLDMQTESASNWTVTTPSEMKTNLPRLEVLEDGSILSTGDITKRDVFEITFKLDEFQKPITAIRLEVLPDDRLPARGPGQAFYEGRKGDFFLSEFTAEVDGKSIDFNEASHSFGKISIGNGSADAANVLDGDGSTGWSTATREGEPHQLVLNFTEPVSNAGKVKIELLFERHFAASLGRFRFSFSTDDKLAKATELPVAVEQKLAESNGQVDAATMERLKRHFLLTTPELADARKTIDKLRKSLAEFPTTMIFRERPADNPRPTFRHHRGEYLSARERVEPHLPDVFKNAKAKAPTDRLEFARWLVSENNPLVGRVTVNRHWQAFFGRGLVRTSEDFGLQSSFPSHPELLDWLAVAFTSPNRDGEIALNWSRKKLHRLIVTSSTYRQSSLVNEQQLTKDPENIFLARGPRFRMNAEMIRDATLKSAGLLSSKIGGPSVYPPQPETVVKVAYGNPQWPISSDEDRYRRSLYTFSKRTAPFAAYAIFDAPTGENCIVRRDRSNTPLQALTLLNDEMFLEAARSAAEQEYDTEKPPRDIATDLFRRFLIRHPSEAEVGSILDFHANQIKRLDTETLDAKTITKRDGATTAEAAWVMVARVLMNLDETVTKP